MNQRDIECVKQVLTTEWATSAELRKKLVTLTDIPLGICNRVPNICVQLDELGVIQRKIGPKGLSEWRLKPLGADLAPLDTPAWLRGLM